MDSHTILSPTGFDEGDDGYISKYFVHMEQGECSYSCNYYQEDEDDGDHEEELNGCEEEEYFFTDYNDSDADSDDDRISKLISKFMESYSVSPVSENSHIEAGNNIILPESTLARLIDFGVEYPMLFKIENPINGRTCHCGVLEFMAEEGVAFMPNWMMKNMSIEKRGLVNLESVTLPSAIYIKVQPHSMEFLNIQSPTDVLKASLIGGYSCLTVGDTIVIMHEDKKFYVDIVDAMPATAVCVIDTDIKVDFNPPLDYKEPEQVAEGSIGQKEFSSYKSDSSDEDYDVKDDDDDDEGDDGYKHYVHMEQGECSYSCNYQEDEDVGDHEEELSAYGEEEDFYIDDNGSDIDADDDRMSKLMPRFMESYSVSPVSRLEKSHIEAGNQIILPESALARLIVFGVEYPMLFKIENPNNGRTSHCGVLEFTAEEGVAVMPDWMMKNMSVEETGLVNLESVTLPRATYIKVQPHSMEFLNIQSPRDVVEASFIGGYSCLTVGDTIVIMHEDKKFYVDIVDAMPATAVCVIGNDVKVDFAPPLDYTEPEKQVAEGSERQQEDCDLPKFVPFCGKPRRLNDINLKTLPTVAETGEARPLNKVDLKEVPEAKQTAIDVDRRCASELCGRKDELVFGGCAKRKTESVEVQSLKPFTGKSYRLMD